MLHGKEIVKGFLYVAVPVGLIVCKNHDHHMKGLQSPCETVEHKMLELPSSEFSRPFLNWEFIIYWFFKFQFLLFSFLEKDGLMLLVFLNFYSCAFYFLKTMSSICFCCQVHAFYIHVGPILFLWGSFCCHAFSEGKYQTHILSTRPQFIFFIYLFIYL